MTSRRMLLSLALGSAAQAKAAAMGLNVAASDREPARNLTGKLFQREDSGYEPLRLAATWNARKPNRFPAAIVVPETEGDIVAAVKLAKARGWQVTARSGGHSFTGSHTRNNALQINMAKMKEISIDPRERIARISPSWKGGPFNNVLRDKHGLTFPVAHGFDVGLGGFVMCGGHGWNSAVHGLGCENLRALDVVTADGELIHCNDRQNSDFLWAARGSGPGFFGVAVRYYLDLHPQSVQTTISEYMFPLELAEEFAEWLDKAPLPRNVEPIVSYFFKDGKPLIHLMAVTFAASPQDLEESRAVLASCPVAKSALVSRINAPVNIPAKSETEDVFSVATGGRFTVDGAYTNAPLKKLFALLRDELVVAPPTPFCTFGVGRWQPIGKVKNMAYSITGRQYVSAMAISYDPATDAQCAEWLARLMERMAPIAVGSQMNDENMPANKLRYLSEDASARLERLRAKYDPDHRFPSFLV